MKVLMTADAVGGVWSYALELSAELSRRGAHVVLATMGPRPDAAQAAAAAAIPRLRLLSGDYKLEWMEDPWTDVERAGTWLLDLAQRESVDVIHLNGYVHATLPWRRPVIAVAHSCVCSWWQAVHGCSPPPQWDTYRQKLTEALHRADGVVAPTEAFARELRSWYGSALRVRVIHNARSTNAESSVVPQERLPIVFACGRVWDEAKNFAALDRAARELPWHTYVAGSASSPDGRCVGVDSLQCLGSLSPHDVTAWMQRAAIFVHPARYEPFGLSVLEAALAGCALVLADLPSLRELWNDAAVFVNPRNERALASTLRALIDDPARRRDLSAAALSRARKFKPDAMAAAYLDLYHELLANRIKGCAVA
jgi:glycogen synthase